jgi:pyruvate dehydrogenase complex dehydrogenase (E1) component
MANSETLFTWYRRADGQFQVYSRKNGIYQNERLCTTESEAQALVDFLFDLDINIATSKPQLAPDNSRISKP